MRADESGMVAVGFLQGRGWLSKPQVLEGTGLTGSQFKDGLQWFRQHGGVTLGYTVVCNRANNTYAVCDEFGKPTDSLSLAGYDAGLTKDRASRAMTGFAVALTAYNRAIVDDNGIGVGAYRKRVRGFRVVLQSYSEEAESIGDAAEVKRIEDFLSLYPSV